MLDENYQQLVLQKNVTLGGFTPKEIELDYFNLFNIRIKIAEEVREVKKDENIHLLFYVHNEDIAKFSSRVYQSYGGQSHFWREQFPNMWKKIPQAILDKYPPIWE